MKRRTPGRPPRRAQQDPRERLLEVAIGCFVEHGIAATSLRQIAQAAGVTPAMLHYYFGNKQRLLETLVEERLMPAFTELLHTIAGEAEDSLALGRRFVSAVFTLVGEQPWLPALWVKEILSEGGTLRPLLTERIAPALPQRLARRFAADAAAGRLAPGLDPRLMVVSLVGLTLFPLAAQPIWREIFGAQDITQEQLMQHSLALLQHGMGIHDA